MIVRHGAPRFAALARDGRPARIVIFGTSITYAGQYLRSLDRRLAEAGFPNVDVHHVGLWGFSSPFASFRLERDVLPLRPDLLIFEFSVNDGDVIDEVPHALHAMIARVRAELPACDIALLYFAPGPHVDAARAIEVHEAIADYYGLPSIDLARVMAELVGRGDAVVSGEGPALTIDGVHQTPLGGELLGAAFDDAILELIATPAAAGRAARPSPPSFFVRARSAPLARFADPLQWRIETPDSEEPSGAYSSELATAVTAGSLCRFSFVGLYLLVWARKSGGAIDLAIDSDARRISLPPPPETGSPWEAMISLLPEGKHDVEIVAARTPVTLADVFIVGEFLA